MNGKSASTNGSFDYASLISVIHWYHTIDLGNGKVTDGDFDLRSIASQSGLPTDMNGLSALDVGSSSGFWAFEMEKRGATVIAIDVAAENQDIASEVFKDGVRQTSSGILSPSLSKIQPVSSFEVAKEVMQSKVSHKELSVYDLSPSTAGVFDFVFCGSLLMHLSDPFRAIQNIRSVTKGDSIISCVTVDDDHKEPLMHFMLNLRSIWTPNKACLIKMMENAGFTIKETKGLDLWHRRLDLSIHHTFISAYVGQ